MSESNLTVQVLVSTMNQSDKSLVDKMNIQTDAIIVNQCNEFGVDLQDHKGHAIQWLHFAERGVGLSRNNALMRSKADILLFADDDMVYYDEYASVVRELFSKNPDVDIVIFNIDEPTQTRRRNTKAHYTKKCGYGAARLAVRRQSVMMHGIFFNLSFGGGTQFSCGEDTLFLRECVKKGLKIYAVPQSIAVLTEERESTWFKGYTDKYFMDQGVLLKISGFLFVRLRALKKAYSDQKRYNKSWIYLYKLYLRGIQFVEQRQFLNS